MNSVNETLANKLALTAIATLLKFKPSIKIDEALTASIEEDISKVLPAHAKVDSRVIDLWAKSVSRKFCVVDSNNPALIHVSDRQLGKMSSGVFAEAFEAETVVLPLVTEQDFRLATAVMNIHKRNCPSHCSSSAQVAKHWAAVCYEAIELILGKLDSNELSESSTNTKIEKDYMASIKAMGLGDFIPHLHKDFMGGVNFQHADDNSAITLHFANLASVHGLLVKTAKKGAFTFAKGNDFYDVVVSSVLDDDFIPVIKLRFTRTKVLPAIVDVNFEL
jgi:hypothetical protein